MAVKSEFACADGTPIKGHPMSEIHDYQVEAVAKALAEVIDQPWENTHARGKRKAREWARAALEAARSAKPPEVEEAVVTNEMAAAGVDESFNWSIFDEGVRISARRDDVRPYVAVYRAMFRARPKVERSGKDRREGKTDAPFWSWWFRRDPCARKYQRRKVSP